MAEEIKDVVLKADLKSAIKALEDLLKPIRANVKGMESLGSGMHRVVAATAQLDQATKSALKNVQEVVKAQYADVITREKLVRLEKQRISQERDYKAIQTEIRQVQKLNAASKEQEIAKTEKLLALNKELNRVFKDLYTTGQLNERNVKGQFTGMTGAIERTSKEVQKLEKQLRTVQGKIDPNQRRMQEAFASGEGLFALQGRLLANYMVWNSMQLAIRGTLREVVALDAEFRQLQAIAGLTDTQLKKLRGTILQISQATRFTGTEVAKAATVLAQAGYSSEEITKTLPAITRLAAATGEDLNDTTALVTSAIDVYNLSVDQSAAITDKFTTAINATKLTLPRLNAGLQYTGNLAAELGVSLDDTIAMMGAMAQSGVRTASMFGTGPRAFLTALAAPTPKVETVFKRLQLSKQELDIGELGLPQVLRNIAESGFTAADAMEAFGTRGGAAFLAVARNIDVLDELRLRMAESGSTTKANDAQMKSLQNTLLKLGAAFTNLMSSALEPLLSVLRGLAFALAEVFEFLYEAGGWLGGFAGFLGKAAVSAIALTQALSALVFTWKSLAGLFAALKTVPWIAGAIGVAGGGLPVLAIAGAVAVAVTAFNSWTDSQEKLTTAAAEANTQLESQTSKVNTLNTTYEKLLDRSETLQTNETELKIAIAETVNQLRDMGLVITDNITSYKELVGLAQKHLQLTEEGVAAQAEQAITAQTALFEAQKRELLGGNIFASTDPRLNQMAARITAEGGGVNDFRNALLGTPMPERAREATLERLNELTQTINRITFNERALEKTLNNLQNFNEEFPQTLLEINEVVRSLKSDPASFIKAGGASNLEEMFDRALRAGGNEQQIDQLVKLQVETQRTLTDAYATLTKAEQQRFKTEAAAINRLEKNFMRMTPQELAAAQGQIAGSLGRRQASLQRMEELMRLQGLPADEIEATITSLRDELSAMQESVRMRAQDTQGRMSEVFDRFDALFDTLLNGLENQRLIVDAELAEIESRRALRAAEALVNRQPAFVNWGADLSDSQQASALMRARLESVNAARSQLQSNFSLEDLVAKQQQASGALTSARLGGNTSLTQMAILEQANKTATENLANYLGEMQKLNQESAQFTQQLAEQLALQRELEVATASQTNAVGSLAYAAREYYDRLRETVTMHHMMKNIGTSSLQAVESSMASFIETTTNGTKKISDAFRDMAMSILKAINQVASQEAAKALLSLGLQALFGASAPAAAPGVVSGGLPTLPGGGSPGYIVVRTGGLVQKFAGGGVVRGGDIGRDTIPALVRPGEYVVQKSAVDVLGRGFLSSINRGEIPVAPVPVTTGGETGTVNVWVVSPDQQPTGLGPNDVVHIVSDNINRGGQIKQLVKQVAIGRRS